MLGLQASVTPTRILKNKKRVVVQFISKLLVMWLLIKQQYNFPYNISVSFFFRPMNFLGGLSNRWTIAVTFGATGSTLITMAIVGKGGISIVPSESLWIKSR